MSVFLFCAEGGGQKADWVCGVGGCMSLETFAYLHHLFLGDYVERTSGSRVPR